MSRNGDETVELPAEALLARRLEVTPSARKVRLERFGLLQVAADGRPYPSRAEAAGQLRMW